MDTETRPLYILPTRDPLIPRDTHRLRVRGWKKIFLRQSEVSQKEKHQYSILTHIYGIQKDGNEDPICNTAKETQMYRTVF